MSILRISKCVYNLFLFVWGISPLADDARCARNYSCLPLSQHDTLLYD
jgi:hypothetical protein